MLVDVFFLCCLCLICYWNGLFGEMVFDDTVAIERNMDIRPSTPISNLFRNDYWGTPLTDYISHHSYRPLTVLTFRFNYYLGSLQPLGYHIVNLTLHCICCCLFQRFCTLVAGCSRFQSLVAALFFACHPIHVEAVSSIVGRAELLMTIFWLLATLCFHNCAHLGWTNWFWCLGAYICTILSSISKEQGFTVVAMFFVQDLFGVYGKVLASRVFYKEEKMVLKPMVIRQSVNFIFAILLILSRLMLHFGVESREFAIEENPARVDPDIWTRTMTFHHLLSINGWLLLFPKNLLADYSHETVPLVNSIDDLRNLQTLIFWVLLLLWGCIAMKQIYSTGIRIQIFAVALMVIPFVPCSNLFMYVGFVVAERLLYLPCGGLCIFGSSMLKRLYLSRRKSVRIIGYMIMVFIIFMYCGRTIRRNIDWETPENLWSSVLKLSPNNPKAYNGMGHALLQRSKTLTNDNDAKEMMDRGIDYYYFSVSLNPKYVESYHNLGIALFNSKRYTEAEESFLHTISLSPKHVDALYMLGLTHHEMGDAGGAEDLLKKAIQLNPRMSSAYSNLGVVYTSMRAYPAAMIALQQAIQLDPTDAGTLLNYGLACGQQPQYQEEAKQSFLKAIALNPSFEAAYFNLGIYFAQKQEYDKAIRAFEITLSLSPMHAAAKSSLQLARTLYNNNNNNNE